MLDKRVLFANRGYEHTQCRSHLFGGRDFYGFLRDSQMKTKTAQPNEISDQDLNPEKLPDEFRKYLGQKVAVISVRYQYRGILSKVFEDGSIELTDPTAIETSGPTRNKYPEREDPIDRPIKINIHCIELFYQPNWVFAPLPSEDGYEKVKDYLR